MIKYNGVYPGLYLMCVQRKIDRVHKFSELLGDKSVVSSQSSTTHSTSWEQVFGIIYVAPNSVDNIHKNDMPQCHL